MRGHAQISVKAQLLTLTSESARRAEPPSQCSTNQDGTRAWILSSEELKDLKQNLKTLPGVDTLQVLGVTTYDGGPAQLFSAGISLSLLPKVAGNSFDLLVGATSTEADSSGAGSLMGVTTNLTAAFQAFLPNSGGVLVKAGTAGDSHQTNHWLIISPVAVDAAGNAIKL
jgi:hypothetical protein